MNFLAHYVIATQYWQPVLPLPDYVTGNALPDLLPLAAPRTRLRVSRLAADTALDAGVMAHLATDAAFHRTAAFAEAQERTKRLLARAGFGGMRIRSFFLAHVLVEMALDAALLRADGRTADQFYAALAEADILRVTAWAEQAAGKPLPRLPQALADFGRTRYLYHYAEDAGVAEGINQLCARARQDRFVGENFTRLICVVSATVEIVSARTPALLEETARAGD